MSTSSPTRTLIAPSISATARMDVSAEVKVTLLNIILQPYRPTRQKRTGRLSLTVTLEEFRKVEVGKARRRAILSRRRIPCRNDIPRTKEGHLIRKNDLPE